MKQCIERQLTQLIHINPVRLGSSPQLPPIKPALHPRETPHALDLPELSLPNTLIQETNQQTINNIAPTAPNTLTTLTTLTTPHASSMKPSTKHRHALIEHHQKKIMSASIATFTRYPPAANYYLHVIPTKGLRKIPGKVTASELRLHQLLTDFMQRK